MSDFPIVASLRESVLNGSQGAKHIGDETETDWIIKPFYRAIDEQRGFTRGTVNEYLAAKLAELIRLPVPEHKPLYLSQFLIDTYPGVLGGFEEGYVLGSRFEYGFDLSIAREQKALMDKLKFGLADYDNRFNAVGIMVGDTWMANADRCAGRHHHFHNNEGNLYFSSSGNGIWTVRAIDFDHAFLAMRWGHSSIATWPEFLLGTMKFFFEIGWLKNNLAEHEEEINSWLQRIGGTDIDQELDNFVASMPAEWLSASNMLASSSDSASLEDLAVRLENHRTRLLPIIRSGYATAVTASKY